MIDTVFKLLALAGFIASLAVLAYYVPDVDLIIALSVVVGMAAYDFLLRPLIRNRRRA
jgi:hypothetical protein